jgi:hypothetical protein
LTLGERIGSRRWPCTMITTWIRRVVLVHLNSSTPFSSSPLSAPRYRRFHPRGPMAEKGNGPSAHPSHKLAYLFSASHGHEHPATIQWSLLDASDQVHEYFACCRAWRFSQKAQPGLDSAFPTRFPLTSQTTCRGTPLGERLFEPFLL